MTITEANAKPIVDELLRRLWETEKPMDYERLSEFTGVTEDLLRTLAREKKIRPVLRRGRVVKFHGPTVLQAINNGVAG